MTSRFLPKNINKHDLTKIISILKSILVGIESLEKYNNINSDSEKIIKHHINQTNGTIGKLFLIHNTTTNWNAKICLDSDIANDIKKVFHLEEQYRQLVIKTWQDELTEINNYDETKGASLIIRSIRNQESVDKKIETLTRKDIGFISTSFLYILKGNDKITPFSHNSDYGLVYNVNHLNFLGASEADARVYQGTKTSVFKSKRSYNTLKKVTSQSNINTDSRELVKIDECQMTLTKTPASLKDIASKKLWTNYNEVALLKEHSKPEVVIQFYYGARFLNRTEKKALELSKFYEIPIIYRERRTGIETFDEFVESEFRYAIITVVENFIRNLRNIENIKFKITDKVLFDIYQIIKNYPSEEEAQKVFSKHIG